MSKVSDYLEKLALSEIEIKLYLSLLESPPITVRELARKTSMGRTTSYPYIDLLLEKGLIKKIVRGSHTFVGVNPPEESLRQIIEQKAQTVKSIKDEFPEIIKTLQTSLPQVREVEEDTIKYFKGIQNARNIYLEALRADELCSYIWIDKTEPLFPSNAHVFSEAFQKNRKLNIREIIYDPESSAAPSKESRSQTGRYFYKYMPKSKKLSSEDILIYNGKVAVINFRGGKTSVVLQNYDLYNNFKEIFELLWSMLPEPQTTVK